MSGTSGTTKEKGRSKEMSETEMAVYAAVLVVGIASICWYAVSYAPVQVKGENKRGRGGEE